MHTYGWARDQGGTQARRQPGHSSEGVQEPAAAGHRGTQLLGRVPQAAERGRVLCFHAGDRGEVQGVVEGTDVFGLVRWKSRDKVGGHGGGQGAVCIG
jgi:hypothetical protein